MTILEERRATILAEASSQIRPGSLLTPTLLEVYYRHFLTEDLADRNPEDIIGAVASHLALAQTRRPGQARVAAFTPRVETHGWAPGYSVLQVVTDDAPFIVDSITAALERAGESVKFLVHPIVNVIREADALIDISPGGTPESWVHVELPQAASQTGLDQLAERVARVLDDISTVVADWGPMANRATELAATLAGAKDDDQRAQASDLLNWMVNDNFVFLGYRRYELKRRGGQTLLTQVPDTGLGLMRASSGVEARPLDGLILQKAVDPDHLLIVTKANARSTVHRSGHLDYIGIKTFDRKGNVNGEHRFIGLFTSGVYNSSALDLPVVSTKVHQVLDRSGFAADSHAGKRLMNLLERFPRDELFQADVEFLTDVTTRIVASRFHRRAQLFVRQDAYGRFASCLVLMPRDLYNADARDRVEDILTRAFEGTEVESSVQVTGSAVAMLHFVIHRPQPLASGDVDIEAVQEWIRSIVRTWSSQWREALVAEFGETEAARLVERWSDGFDEAYRAQHSPRASAVDIGHLESLAPGGLAARLHQEVNARAGERRLRLYADRPLDLTEVLPVLLDFGLRVLDERTHEVRASDGSQTGQILDFGVAANEASWVSGPDPEAGLLPAFLAVWQGRAESDALNRLIGEAGLTWTQVVPLRTVASYLRQTTPYSLEYLEAALVENPTIARQLVDLFATRFLPGSDEDRTEREESAAAAVLASLADVPSLDHDKMLRAFVDVIRATERTNFYQGTSERATLPPDAVALKLDPHRIPHLPAPIPLVETWVYGPRLEGVHLRFGKVARGGLRWSDRRDDFRTEVLGLVKAQAVKNAVIVPAGAKGGFYAKQLPDPLQDRAAWLAEGRASYEEFIGALLSVTDNLRDGVTHHPVDVARHDGDDAYLVVAADKGTASFSDLANEVSERHGFWLADAFASGGSSGYDHKGMAITARGAWESVRRHFLELGVDVQTEEFTAVGVGDMSGDVFGNGMLLSPCLNLVAAFDHRHIFIDPTPDATRSFAERQRMFEMPYSSWADYDLALISPGGGVFPRSAKSIEVSPQMRDALSMGEAVRVTPTELIRAILTAQVDLLWNGGIGTYIKAATESHGDVGDRANDAVRVDGRDLRCRVVGEGGNLGATQLGRIEAALQGVRINTDAIDNSGGVDSSDQEVNIKILLRAVEEAGQMTRTQRDEVLRAMTDDVAASVLRTNYEQNVLLANARHLGGAMLGAHERLMVWLEKNAGLDRALEGLPTTAELGQREKDGRGLTSPEFSVLVAYSKLAIKAALLDSDLPDDSWLEQELAEYFPQPIRTFTAALSPDPPVSWRVWAWHGAR